MANYGQSSPRAYLTINPYCIDPIAASLNLLLLFGLPNSELPAGEYASGRQGRPTQNGVREKQAKKRKAVFREQAKPMSVAVLARHIAVVVDKCIRGLSLAAIIMDLLETKVLSRQGHT